jgi:hypothetical protein
MYINSMIASTNYMFLWAYGYNDLIDLFIDLTSLYMLIIWTHWYRWFICLHQCYDDYIDHSIDIFIDEYVDHSVEMFIEEYIDHSMDIFIDDYKMIIRWIFIDRWIYSLTTTLIDNYIDWQLHRLTTTLIDNYID